MFVLVLDDDDDDNNAVDAVGGTTMTDDADADDGFASVGTAAMDMVLRPGMDDGAKVDDIATTSLA